MLTYEVCCVAVAREVVLVAGAGSVGGSLWPGERERRREKNAARGSVVGPSVEGTRGQRVIAAQLKETQEIA